MQSVQHSGQNSGQAFQVTEIEAGIFQIHFDLLDSPVNVFNHAVFAELSSILDALAQQESLVGCVFTSGKQTFAAGADIPVIFAEAKNKTEQEVGDYIGVGHTVFNQIQNLPCLTVAAINGLALGGGFEFVLACDLRVATEQAKLGLPEVNLGIFPGWGGTVRLPRLMQDNVDLAAQWIASGQPQGANVLLEYGVVSKVVADPQALIASAVAKIKEQQGHYRSLRQPKEQPLLISEQSKQALDALLLQLDRKPGPDYPASKVAVQCIIDHASLNGVEAGQVELARFAHIIKTDTAVNLLSVFLNEQATKRVAKRYCKQAEDTQQAAVIGAGIMGGGIAYQSALRGVPVVMKDIRQDALDLGMTEAERNFSVLVEKGRMDEAVKQQALSKITPTLESDALSQADMVVEAVVENTKIKQAVLAELEQQIPEGAILTSNTSTISITRLAKALERPEQFCGMHFFNPVPLMPLVEVIRGEHTSEATIARVVNYAVQLGKKPIVVNDCPAFLVNRVLFPYLNAMMMLIEEGVDFQQIDRVMEAFGWPMGPAFLSDVVGLDTLCHCIDVLAADIPERMAMPFKTAAHKFIELDRLGQKNKLGFYQYSQNDKGRLQKHVDPSVYSIVYSSEPKQIDDDDIVQRLMGALCLEMVRCLEEGVVASAAEADMAMLWGIGFPRFRGGAIRYIDTLGTAKFCTQMERYAHLGAMYQIPTLLSEKRAKNKTFY